MNLTGEKVYLKGEKRKRSTLPTPKQRETWGRIAALGCSVCGRAATIHHCGTGAGGRKNHDYVIGLCPEHHTGPNGIDGQVLSKRGWQVIYGTEKYHHDKTMRLLGEKQT